MNEHRKRNSALTSSSTLHTHKCERDLRAADELSVNTLLNIKIPKRFFVGLYNGNVGNEKDFTDYSRLKGSKKGSSVASL